MEVEQCKSFINTHNDPLPDKVTEAIKKIIKKEGYKEYKLASKVISTAGGNYFGSLYEVDITGQTEDGDKVTNLFVKVIIPAEHFTVLSVTGMFGMELFFYNDLAVVLEEIQNEAAVPLKERYNIAKTFQESIPEAIILDNLAKKGYKTLHRLDVISLDFAKLCIEQLGKLHGLSFVLERKRPEYFERKIKTLSCPYNFNEEFKAMFINSSKTISASLDDEGRQRFDVFVPKLWENVQRFFGDQKYKRTIIHCDYRPNNILVKEIDGDIIDVVPVDYQLLHYGCPLIDFFYFIFLGTDQQLRTNLEDLKNLYFDSLTTMLKYFNIDVKSVFPREDFEDLYNETLSYGLYCFIQLMPFVFAAEDDIPDLKKDYAEEITIKTDDRMKDRARGIVDDFIRWGVL